MNKTELYQVVRSKNFAGFLKAVTVVIMVFFYGSEGSVFAQDILILKSGKELKVTIVEETGGVIKYREFENPTGPLYSVNKNNVAEVKYKKATRETQAVVVTEPVKPADITVPEIKSNMLTTKKRYLYLDGVVQAPRSVRLLLEDQPEALNSYESAKKMFTASNICPITVMIISFAASRSIQDMPEQEDKTRVGLIVLSIDGALIISGILLASAGKKKLRNTVSLYKPVSNSPVQYSLNFGMQENGVGLALRF